MKKITTHSKSGLFLMEMIFVLLFLGLTCGICVRLFAASYMARIQAREKDHILELVTSTGEILEGTDGSANAFLSLMPDGTASQNVLHYFFDQKWQKTAPSDAVYDMCITLVVSDTIKSADIRFDKISNQTEHKELYSQTIRYPNFPKTQGADL